MSPSRPLPQPVHFVHYDVTPLPSLFRRVFWTPHRRRSFSGAGGGLFGSGRDGRGDPNPWAQGGGFSQPGLGGYAGIGSVYGHGAAGPAPLLDHAANTRPSRCVGFDGLGARHRTVGGEVSAMEQSTENPATRSGKSLLAFFCRCWSWRRVAFSGMCPITTGQGTWPWRYWPAEIIWRFGTT